MAKHDDRGVSTISPHMDTDKYSNSSSLSDRHDCMHWNHGQVLHLKCTSAGSKIFSNFCRFNNPMSHNPIEGLNPAKFMISWYNPNLELEIQLKFRIHVKNFQNIQNSKFSILYFLVILITFGHFRPFLSHLRSNSRVITWLSRNKLGTFWYFIARMFTGILQFHQQTKINKSKTTSFFQRYRDIR